MYDFIIRGARGTIPACGPEYTRHGGNTTCFSVQTDSGLVIFDAGTAIMHVARDLTNRSVLPPITLFFTHFHLDHVIGFPCFDPVYHKNTEITIMADPLRRSNWKDTLNTLMGKPYWPVGLGECAAMLRLVDLPANENHLDCHGLRISWFRVPHPQQCLAYRVDMTGNSVIIATDMECDTNMVQPAFLQFCSKADYLICDAQFTPEEYPSHCGWGHSTWEAGALIAREAGVKRLILTHHAPTRTDTEIDAIVEAARKKFPMTSAATEDMVLNSKTKFS